ncbi:hypothetical protein XI06_06520 [Bradyrhizobium sp. CCBAU 11434]|uniref:hypothetical protein n=1 Tax=Bradyrhizobium sp. CCBAU 11434 TaxID=1630885 RepID=UPI0023069EC9|nr:hypothetical protein [Bradyrhizobium sp. CCBAU 11434]MDA9520023.1 hypothetical protein [Bradyrhizobium sp. CCBAU 11434]
MAKTAKRVIKEPSQREILQSIKRIQAQEMVTESQLVHQVTEILKAGKVRVLEQGKSRRMMGDLLASRTELGQERRYSIEVALEISNEKIREHFGRFRNYVRQSKQPFQDFDEYWLVGYKYAGEAMRKRPENDRHFRVLDLEELRTLFVPPRSPKPKGKAQTKIGKAIETNEKEILLAITGLILQIDSKIETLRDLRPNSPEAIAEQGAHISEYERMRAELERIQVMVNAFKKGEQKEAKVVKSVKTFAEGVQGWWTKKHDEILAKTFDMGLFTTALGICSMAGAGGKFGVVVSAALVGGKPVAQALKGLLPKNWSGE